MLPGGRSVTIPTIQVLRAAAALAVFGAHLMLELEKWSGVAVPHQTVIGGAGVDLFFVISGFIMVHVSGDLFGRVGAGAQFMARRLIRIVPLYWLLCAPLALHAVVRYSDLTSADLSAGLIAASFAFIPWPRPTGELEPLLRPGWTLNYEMFFYVLFALSLAFRPRRAVMATSAALIACVAAAPLLDPRSPYWPDSIVLEFIFGMAIATARREKITLSARACLALIMAGVTGLAWSVIAGAEVPRVIWWGIPAALVVAGATLHPFELRSPAWQVPILLGDASYALYLIHPFMNVPRLIAQRLLGWTDGPWLWWPAGYALFLAALIVGAAIATHLVVEKPLLRVLRTRLIAPGRLAMG